jgi:hypothetical protein
MAASLLGPLSILGGMNEEINLKFISSVVYIV